MVHIPIPGLSGGRSGCLVRPKVFAPEGCAPELLRPLAKINSFFARECTH